MLLLSPQDGDTPLLCACWQGFQPIVECLLHHGCSLDASNGDGDTCLHIAAVRGYYNIVRYLCEHGVSKDTVNNVSVLLHFMASISPSRATGQHYTWPRVETILT